MTAVLGAAWKSIPEIHADAPVPAPKVAAPRARSYASRLMAASKTAQKSCSSLPIARARL